MSGIIFPPSGGGLGGTGGLIASGQINLTTNIQPGGGVDTISTVDGIATIGQVSSDVSVSDYVSTRTLLLAWFNMLLENIASDNSSNITQALMKVIGNLPSAGEIQSLFNLATSVAAQANTDISSLNNYNSTLNGDANTITTAGTNIQNDANQVSSADVPDSVSNQNAQVQGFITDYEDGNISLSDFQSDVSAIYNTAQTTANGLTNSYDDAVSQYQTYTGAVTNYNSSVGSPPVTQTQYNADQSAVNAYNTQAGGVFPNLATLPDITVATTPLSPTQTTLSSNVYGTVTYPNPSDYSFTTTDSNGNTIPNMQALDQFLSDFQAAGVQASSNSAGITSSLNSFLTTDYATQSAQLPTLSTTPIPSLTVSSYSDYVTDFLTNVVASSTSNISGLNNLFGSLADANNPSNAPTAQDANSVSQLVDKSTNAVGAIGLGAVGGVAILNVGGLTDFNSLSTTFQAQMEATNNAVADNPNLSTSAHDFWRSLGNHLQSVIGASSVLGTITGYRDASNFFYNSNELNGPLLALNDLESYNSLIGNDNTATLNQLASGAAPNASASDVQLLASTGDVVLAYSTQIQRDALGAQAVQGDQQAFSALYLAGYTGDVINGIVAKGNLTSEQQQSVVNAQGTLVGFLNSNNVSFNTLNNTAQVASDFQSAGQQLAALGFTISPTDLANAQAAFLASLPTGPVTSSAAQQLLLAAITANVQNVPANVVANAVQFQFIQNEESYRIEVQNDFKQNSNINVSQSQGFTDRFNDALLGDAYNTNVQFLVNSSLSGDQDFAEELATATVNAQEDLIQNNILSGTPNLIPGTDILSTAITAKNDLTGVPAQTFTAKVPV